MEKLIKGIIEFREESKEESIESGIYYAIGWLNLEFKFKENPKIYTSSDVLRLLEVIKNLNQLEEGNKMFKCIKELVLSVYDDDNEVIENEHIKIDKGSEWFIQKCDYCENDIRLVNDNAEWVEISIRTFKEHFVNIEK
jgi:hypothetical protein